MRDRAATRPPLLVWFLAGALLGPLAGRESVGPPRDLAPIDLVRSAPRDLRRLPGIGDRRAIDIARARWNHPPGAAELDLTDVHGIGAGTAASVRAALRVPVGERLVITEPP